MRVAPADISSLSAVKAALAGLDPVAADLALTLLVGVGAGESVPERFRADIEEDGEPLWLAGLLLPRGTPSRGATIDPRFYAAFCRVNPALSRLRLLPELAVEDDLPPHPPPTDARWDAIVVSARFEAEAPRLTQQGLLRKDDRRRLIDGLGGDPDRWALALEVARATGLVRPAAGALHGFPESKPRPLTEPASLVEEGGPRRAADALLRVAGARWLPLDALVRTLGARCPAVLDTPRGDFGVREAGWFAAAADALHRVGVIEARRDAAGVVAVRRGAPPPPRPPGFLLTPDREILVGPGELPGPEYGRLCRLAPYHDGDVVHRHRLSREGVAADLAAGHDDAVGFLERRSRTGVPRSVRESIAGWISAASRVSLLTGATVLEEDGRFSVVERGVPAGARELFYDEQPPADFRVQDGELRVRFGEDPLTVRAAVARVGEALPAGPEGWRWRLAPRDITAPDRVLDRLRRYHAGEVPGELEAAVLGAAGLPPCRVEAAVVVHLPERAVAALRRDRVAGPLLAREVAPGQCVVDRADLPTLRERLAALGFRVDGP